MAFSFVGFVGAYNYNEKLTKIYYFFTLVQVVLEIIGVIVTAVTIADFAADGCIAAIDVAQCEAAFETSFYITAILSAFTSPCFATVIRSASRYDPSCVHGQLERFVNRVIRIGSYIQYARLWCHQLL